MDCANELRLARTAYQRGNLVVAKRHFGRAHGACHADKKLHLASHWGLARVGLRQKRPLAAARHLFLIGFAAIFS